MPGSRAALDPPPIASIISHGEGDEVIEGVATQLVGTVSDRNVGAEKLRARYLDGDVVCPDETPTEDGRSTYLMAMEVGSPRITLEVRDSSDVAASASISPVVVQNHAPRATILAPLTGSTSAEGDDVALNGVVSDEEDEEEDLTA